jgi:hypothetical protein
MSSLSFRITDVSAFTAAACTALRKRAEVIQTKIMDGTDIGVIIIGNVGCVGIVGKLWCNKEVFVN